MGSDLKASHRGTDDQSCENDVSFESRHDEIVASAYCVGALTDSYQEIDHDASLYALHFYPRSGRAHHESTT